MNKTESVLEIAAKLLNYNEDAISYIILSQEILLSLRKHVEISEKNKIPAMFIIWRSDCYKSIIVGLRKIMEPNDKKGKSLAVLVDLIKNNEQVLCENHINSLLKENKTAKVCRLSPENQWETREEDKFEEKLRCILSHHKKMENVNSLSGKILINEYKNMLKEKIRELAKKYEDYTKTNDSLDTLFNEISKVRNHLVHSGGSEEKLPIINLEKMEKAIDDLAEFLDDIWFILRCVDYCDRKCLREQFSRECKSFWSLVQKPSQNLSDLKETT